MFDGVERATDDVQPRLLLRPFTIRLIIYETALCVTFMRESNIIDDSSFLSSSCARDDGTHCLRIASNWRPQNSVGAPINLTTAIDNSQSSSCLCQIYRMPSPLFAFTKHVSKLILRNCNLCTYSHKYHLLTKKS